MGRLLTDKRQVHTLDISGFGKGIYLIHEKQGSVVKVVVL